MRLVQYFATFTMLSFVLSVGAFAKAKDTHSGKFDLLDAARVGSTQLAPGHYKVEWNGPPDQVKINILKNGKTVATARGHIKDLANPAPYDAVTTKTLSNNRKALDEIQFDNRTQALEIAN